MREADATMRILIADDEPPARRQLRRILESLSDVAIVGEAEHGLEALRLAEALQPDVLILDIQMPEMTGLDVAANLSAPVPQVIFSTAFDEHAIRAFELAAVDYLLKPWDAPRLILALERARERKGSRIGSSSIPPLAPVQRLLVRDGEALKVLATEDIISVFAQDNYVILHTAERDWMLREPISALLERLHHPSLIRVHRSYAVNLGHVRELLPLFKGDGEVVLSDAKRIPYSRNYREQLLQRLERM